MSASLVTLYTTFPGLISKFTARPSCPAVQRPKQLVLDILACWGVIPAWASFSLKIFVSCVLPSFAQRLLVHTKSSYLAGTSVLSSRYSVFIVPRIRCDVNISCTRPTSTRSYLTGIDPGVNIETIGSLLHLPVHPVRCRTISPRPLATMCLRNSSYT